MASENMWKFCTLLFFFHLLASGRTEEEDETECMKKQKNLALLDLTEDTISKAKEHVPKCSGGNATHPNASNCGERGKTLAFLDIAANLVSDVKGNYSSCTGGKTPLFHQKPMDCSEVLENGQKKSGVYTIWPRSRFYCNKSLDVYCDMETDGGGWTVIERKRESRQNSDFDRQWNRDIEQFENGFGNITEEFYIGNKPLHVLSNQGGYELRGETSDASGNKFVVIHDTFWMDDARTNYTMHTGNSRQMGNSSILTVGTSLSVTSSIRRNCTDAEYVTTVAQTTVTETTLAPTTPAPTTTTTFAAAN